MITGVGPALVDRICLIDEFPERGGHAVVKKTERHAGGAAGNVIFGLAGFGIKTRFVSTIGDDDDGVFYKNEMEKAGVECLFKLVEAETGRVDVFVDKSGERTFFVYPNASALFYPFLNEDDYRWGKYFYLDPFPFEGSLTAHLEIAKKAKEFGKIVILNPGYPYSKLGIEGLKDLLEFTDIIFLSQDEYRMVEGIENYVSLTVITKGSKGSVALIDGDEYYAPAFEVDVIDTTGAGDAFTAGFLYAYIKRFDIETCLFAGNFSASYNIRKIGARNFPEKRDMDEFLRHQSK